MKILMNQSQEERLFTYKDNQQIWVVLLINNRIRAISLEIVKERTSAIMKKIINTFVPKGNIIITDGALCYSCLDNADSGYTHHFHNHGHDDFDETLDSISHAEQLWNNLKSIIKKIYFYIPNNNFVLYLRESEWRRNQKKFDDNKNIMTSFEEDLKYNNNNGNINLYDIDYLSKIF